MAVIALPSMPRLGRFEQPGQRPQNSVQIGSGDDQLPMLLALLSFIGQQRDSSNRLAFDKEVLGLHRDQAKLESNIATQGAIGQAESELSQQLQNRIDSKMQKFAQRQTDVLLPKLNQEVQSGASKLDSINNRIIRIQNNERMPESERQRELLSAVNDLQTETMRAVNEADSDLQRFGISQRFTTILNRASSLADGQAAREINAAAENFAQFQRVYPPEGAESAVSSILGEQATQFANQLRTRREEIGNKFGSLRESDLDTFQREGSKLLSDFTNQQFEVPELNKNLIRQRTAFGGVSELPRRSEPSRFEEGGVLETDPARAIGSPLVGSVLGQKAQSRFEQSMEKEQFGDILSFLGPLAPVFRKLAGPDANALHERAVRFRDGNLPVSAVEEIRPRGDRVSPSMGLFQQPQSAEQLFGSLGGTMLPPFIPGFHGPIPLAR